MTHYRAVCLFQRCNQFAFISVAFKLDKLRKLLYYSINIFHLITITNVCLFTLYCTCTIVFAHSFLLWFSPTLLDQQWWNEIFSKLMRVFWLNLEASVLTYDCWSSVSSEPTFLLALKLPAVRSWYWTKVQKINVCCSKCRPWDWPRKGDWVSQ